MGWQPRKVLGLLTLNPLGFISLARAQARRRTPRTQKRRARAGSREWETVISKP